MLNSKFGTKGNFFLPFAAEDSPAQAPFLQYKSYRILERHCKKSTVTYKTTYEAKTKISPTSAFGVESSP